MRKRQEVRGVCEESEVVARNDGVDAPAALFTGGKAKRVGAC
jgi:hypothetical protein